MSILRPEHILGYYLPKLPRYQYDLAREALERGQIELFKKFCLYGSLRPIVYVVPRKGMSFTNLKHIIDRLEVLKTKIYIDHRYKSSTVERLAEDVNLVSILTCILLNHIDQNPKNYPFNIDKDDWSLKFKIINKSPEPDWESFMNDLYAEHESKSSLFFKHVTINARTF